MKKVALTYCNNYAIKEVKYAVLHLMELLQISPEKEFSGKKILLKPNLLNAFHPDKAVTTHPVFVEAVIQILKDYECRIWLGDSPNGVQKSLEHVWSVTGMTELCDRYGIQKRYFEKEGATLIGDVLVANPVLEADYIINLPKFKTHGLTILTAAVKNMFGISPGLRKSNCHRLSKTRMEFAERLVKIAETGKPDLNIVDGIVSMAGNGPSGGYPVETKFAACSRNMHRLDAVLAELVGLDPSHLDTVTAASQLGMIDLNEKIEIVGCEKDEINLKGFKLPVTYTSKVRNSKFFSVLISGLLSRFRVRPKVISARCKKCGMCVRICPVQAIDFSAESPFIDNDCCIECYCCHETCPENAIDLRESILLKFAKRLAERRQGG